MRQEDREISVLDMIFSLLEKWRALVAITIIFALIGTGFGAIKASKAKTPNTKAEISALEATMTEEEIADVKSAASIINEYRTMYNAQKKYNDSSIYQKLDPYNVRTATLKYYVDNDYKVYYPIISESNNLIPIVQTYISVVSKDSVMDRMSKEIDTKIDPLYFSEMISTSIDDAENQDSGLFVITIMADSDEHLEKMVAIVKDELEKSVESTVETYGAHALTLAFESYSKTSNPTVYETQQKNIQNLTVISQAISDTEKSFSGNQLSYLKGLVHEELSESVSVVKYTVLGGIGAFGVYFVAQLLVYLLSGTIRTTRELSSCFNAEALCLVGITASSKNSKIDRWIKKVRRRKVQENALELASTKIELLAKKSKINDVCVVLDECVPASVVESFSINDIKTCVVTDIKNNPDSLQSLFDSSAVVLAVMLDKTKVEDVSFVVNRANQYELPILGTIVVM